MKEEAAASAAGELASIPHVCEVETVAAPGADPAAPPDLLLEVPHGATRERHYDEIRQRLVGDLPEDLRDFFFVNTDVGAPECAERLARLVATRGDPRKVLVVRSLVPRTFIDCNRRLDAEPADYGKTGITAAVPSYVTDPADRATLRELHGAYVAVAERAYALVCGAGGLALTLHTYAPRSVHVDVDRDIGAALRRAYEPGVYESWEPRPDVDLITETDDGARLAPPGLVAAVREQYARCGIAVTENVSYRLHPATLGHLFSTRYPGRVLCLEINRALLADPFTPFAEMRIGEEMVERMAAPLAAAYWGNAVGG